MGGKGGRCVRLTTLPPSCSGVMKSGNRNFLEPSGPLQACNETDLPFKWRIFQRPLNVSPDFAVVDVKACVVLHNFVGYGSEDALRVTGLLKMCLMNNQHVGLTANSVRNKVVDYFETDAGAASWRMSKM